MLFIGLSWIVHSPIEACRANPVLARRLCVSESRLAQLCVFALGFLLHLDGEAPTSIRKLRCLGGVETKAAGQESGEPMRIFLGLLPSAGPTIPLRSIMSMIRPARA